MNMDKDGKQTGGAAFKPVTHVIFDVDGLLVDSEHYYSLALGEVAKRYGKEFTAQIKREMMGTKPMEGANLCLDRLELRDKLTPEQFVAAYETELNKNCHRIKLMPGAERLIRHLSSKQVPMAIATGAAQQAFERKTGHLGAIMRAPFSHHVFAGSDPEVARGKPHPDVFQVAAKRFRSPPKDMQSVLVFEDAVNGVRAALTAGMQAVLVPDRKWLDPNDLPIKPTQVIDSLEHFKPELFGLPPFDK